MCTFRASCYSTRLSWTHTPIINWPLCLGQKVSEKDEGVVALHLPTGPLKTCSGLEPVPRCQPSTYQPITWWHSHCAIRACNITLHWLNLLNKKIYTLCPLVLYTSSTNCQHSIVVYLHNTHIFQQHSIFIQFFHPKGMHFYFMLGWEMITAL